MRGLAAGCSQVCGGRPAAWLLCATPPSKPTAVEMAAAASEQGLAVLLSCRRCTRAS